METDFSELITDVLALYRGETEVLLVVLALLAISLLASYFIPKFIFLAYETNALPQIQQVIIEMIYQLDKYADEMSNKEKRSKCISKLHKLLRFGNKAVPKSICGLIVDIQVTRIRALQKSCKKDADLHKG